MKKIRKRKREFAFLLRFPVGQEKPCTVQKEVQVKEIQVPGKQPSADVATVLLADALPVQVLKALKDAGVPLRWAPLGRVFTVPEWGDRAQAVLTTFEALNPSKR